MGNRGADLMNTTARPTWTAEDSVKAQLQLIDSATLEKSGGYYQHTGEALPF